MLREVRYWNSRQFFRVYGRDPSATGFPRQDADGCYLTMGYRIRLDDGQPEDGEPSPHPSDRVVIDPPVLAPDPVPTPVACAPSSPGRVSFRHFEHSGGFDGYEGRMMRHPDSSRPKDGRR
ncbi:hypothetical protein [Methylobacterium dankookense]|uniref:Uncharacterized protein n=1 Tax=Methylobacterium dankookense TaxID=560405 RepID=A0A564G295_9HYPH|nr:hypothetical protein [Methylobacterium dankookense]GJD55852.1 hypothetical protein IFDJLNFL_1743 [Methylobacterium dankookense]VUF14136.1 hypothetical protein MTDSW087_03851 [Methylobacterium dankookense]